MLLYIVVTKEVYPDTYLVKADSEEQALTIVGLTRDKVRLFFLGLNETIAFLDSEEQSLKPLGGV